jgi:hypothetical protein
MFLHLSTKLNGCACCEAVDQHHDYGHAEYDDNAHHRVGKSPALTTLAAKMAIPAVSAVRTAGRTVTANKPTRWFCITDYLGVSSGEDERDVVALP